MNNPLIKIGLFGIGLNTYWPQFKGLKERLEGYLQRIHDQLKYPSVEVINAGLVDSPEKAQSTADLFKQQDAALIFLYVSTYALSSTVLPVVQKARVPVIVLNLQPVPAIDYQWFNRLGDRGKMTAEWLAHCQACSLPEIASVFNRARIPFHQITGTLDDRDAWREIGDWIAAGRVAEVLRKNRVGILGHYYNGMLDVYSDPTQHAAFFGCHLIHLEMDELKLLRAEVQPQEIKQKISELHAEFDVSAECDPREIERAAHTAVALDKLAEKHRLGSLCYYYEGTPGNEHENIVTSVIPGNSLLTARHIPVAGECELKNVQAMKIMDAFGAGGSFTEFYAMDFNEDILLMGHDGPGHIAIAQGKPKLKPLGIYHGKPGRGVSVEMQVKQGPVTILSVIQHHDGQLRFLVAEGESVAGPILEIGNTNSRYKFSVGVKHFINQWSKAGPAHHCAVGVGHIAAKIEKLSALLGMEMIHVC